MHQTMKNIIHVISSVTYNLNKIEWGLYVLYEIEIRVYLIPIQSFYDKDISVAFSSIIVSTMYVSR